MNGIRRLKISQILIIFTKEVSCRLFDVIETSNPFPTPKADSPIKYFLILGSLRPFGPLDPDFVLCGLRPRDTAYTGQTHMLLRKFVAHALTHAHRGFNQYFACLIIIDISIYIQKHVYLLTGKRCNKALEILYIVSFQIPDPLLFFQRKLQTLLPTVGLGPEWK